jgi:hypothetical protein
MFGSTAGVLWGVERAGAAHSGYDRIDGNGACTPRQEHHTAFQHRPLEMAQRRRLDHALDACAPAAVQTDGHPVGDACPPEACR